MLIDIAKEDYLPSGRYALMNLEKIARVKASLPVGSNERSFLIEYDKIGGNIVDVINGKAKMPLHTFWNIEKQKMNDSVEKLSDDELLVIIRKAENTAVPGSRYQRANTEWQIRHQQKLVEATKLGRGGVFLEVGGDMINDGVIQTGEGAQIGVSVAGSYKSNKGKIIQGGGVEKVWWQRPEIIISIMIALVSIPWWPNIISWISGFVGK